MALTASRSELNVAIVGESDVADALAKTKAEMAALEAKVRSLTGATKAQNSAVEASTSPLKSANGAMTGLAKKAEGLVEGVDKIKGAFNKVVESAGFIGMAVTGAVTAFEFLCDAFDDTAEKTARLEREMKIAEARAKAFAQATDTVSSSLARLRGQQAAAGQSIATEMEEMFAALGDEVSAAEQKVQIKIEAARSRQLDFERQISASRVEATKNTEITIKMERDLDSIRAKARADEEKFQERRSQLAMRSPRELEEFRKTEEVAFNARQAQFDRELKQRQKISEEAKKAIELSKLEIASLEDRAITADITAKALVDVQRETVSAFFKAKEDKGGGGGGAAQDIKAQAELMQHDREQFLAWLKQTAEETAAVNRARADGMKADASRRAAVKDEAALFDELGVMRTKVSRELADLPTTGVTAEAFKGLREQLAKQLADIDRLMGARVAASRDGAMTTAEEDAITAALTKQREEMEKLVGTMGSLSDARTKSNEEARQMAEAARRSLPVERMNELKDGIDQLQQMSIPAFSDIATVVGQVSEQFQRYKDKQTDMTGAAINSASAIAGSIAKQIGGVKAEAGVRALFELAMGFATIANPVESAGHFSASALFGLVAGGVIKSGAASGAGGQKAPATRAAQTQQVGGNGGGGGSITNVYNLQTGIVDGQSTAQAFRRAEQQARNTGMATAGGW